MDGIQQETIEFHKVLIRELSNINKHLDKIEKNLDTFLALKEVQFRYSD